MLLSPLLPSRLSLLNHYVIGILTIVLGVCHNELHAKESTCRVVKLECEHLTEPLAVETQSPRLTWQMSSEERGVSQSAYEVIVSSTREKLAANDGDLWASGRVESSQSLLVPYKGKSLNSFQDCHWKVRIWDQSGDVSQWSDDARWSMGILDPALWQAQWIGREEPPRTEFLTGTNWIWFDESGGSGAAPGTAYFRKSFVVEEGKRVENVLLRICADDRCTIFLDGREIGSRGGYRSTKEMDITARIGVGEHMLAVSVVNEGEKPSPAGLVALMTMRFADGTEQRVGTDASWKASQEAIDGWMESDFVDSSWKNATDLGSVGCAPWGAVRHAEDRRLAARYLRKEFAVDKPVRRAIAYYSGLGVSELYVNGSRIGDSVLSPGATEYPKRTFYVAQDVTANLQVGMNAMGVILGNGRYYSPRSEVYAKMPTYGLPKLRMHLRVEHEDGTVFTVASDTRWRMSVDGPITANNEYDGEDYDARKELKGWTEPGFNESGMLFAEHAVAPEGLLVSEPMEPIRVTETIRPVGIRAVGKDRYIVDMGQNLVGWCRIRVKGNKGQTVTLRHAENATPIALDLANIRGALVTDRYTLSGDGVEEWEPRFTYHGFRYVEVTGWPGRMTIDDIEGRVVHDDMERIGFFECSDETVNQVFKNVVWGTRGNYRSMPTDCPQRDERQGWLGDRCEESRGEAFLYDIAPLYLKWLTDIADAQREDGSLPDVAPSHWPIYTNNVTWPSAFLFIPRMLEDQYGDGSAIEKHYQSQKRWVDLMLGYTKDGISDQDQYGDWCVPPEDPLLIHSVDPNRQTNKSLLATSYLYHDLMLLSEYAKRLGFNDDANHYQQKAREVFVAFNDRFWNEENGYYDNGSQTSCVLPLYFGLVPPEHVSKVFGQLTNKIEVETKRHIGTGLIGGQYLMRTLTKYGRGDLALEIASQVDYPSWGYMISKNATTIWELWNGDTADPAMNSGNHVMLVGDFVIWLFEDVAGISPTTAQPGYKLVRMQPHFLTGLQHAKGEYETPYGKVASHWKRFGEGIEWSVAIPPNVEAEIQLDVPEGQTLTINGQALAVSPFVREVVSEGTQISLKLGSGKYDVMLKRSE